MNDKIPVKKLKKHILENPVEGVVNRVEIIYWNGSIPQPKTIRTRKIRPEKMYRIEWAKVVPYNRNLEIYVLLGEPLMALNMFFYIKLMDFCSSN